MNRQPHFAFDDPDSHTRDRGLDVVVARAEKVRPFDMDMFAGFSTMRALTYTPSIPMIVGLLRDHDYDEFECIFGHNGILTRDAVDIMSFQSVIDERLNHGFVAVKGMSDERRDLIYNRAADGTARFYVVKDAIAHAKIYLLEREDLRRVIVGSANLSETAFSGRQAETLVVFDNDETAWGHYVDQYAAMSRCGWNSSATTPTASSAMSRVYSAITLLSCAGFTSRRSCATSAIPRFGRTSSASINRCLQ